MSQFDRVDANLSKLEAIWERLANEAPSDIAFGTDTNDTDNLRRSFDEIASQLPAIDGFKIESAPMSFDEIAEARFEARELGELSVSLEVERNINHPGTELAEYRFRFERTRQKLVRHKVSDVVDRIDAVVAHVVVSANSASWKGRDRWDELNQLASELDRLVGKTVPDSTRWNDFRRHLHFGEPHDLRDIASLDWPSVRQGVMSGMYDEYDPIPITVDDLGEMVRADPSGRVSTRIDWSVLDDNEFERLLFELLTNSQGYENVNWLMKTNAPDRGRDIEATRVVNDVLSGVKRYRVVVQCKHWLSRSIGRDDLVASIEAVRLWEPPSVDVLVMATSGRFSQDAVALAERRNHDRSVPQLELWPDSHMETLLSRRPTIAATFGLR